MLGSILGGGNKIPQDWLLSQKIKQNYKGGEEGKGVGKWGQEGKKAKQLRGTKRSLTGGDLGSED